MLLATLLLTTFSSATHVPNLAPVHDPAVVDLSHAIPVEPYAPRYRAQGRNDDGYATGRSHNPWYFGIQGGFTSTRKSSDGDVDLDFDDGIMLGALLGYRFTDGGVQTLNWAAELDLIWTDQDIDASGTGPIDFDASSDMSVFAFLINGVMDFLFTPRFGAYAAAGLGMSFVDLQGVAGDPFDFDEEDGPFLSWQLKVGLQFLFGKSMALRGGYRFLNIDNVELDDSINDARFDLETRQHILELSLLWGF